MPGSWETQFAWTRRAIHMIHLRSGKFMTWADNPAGTPITIWTPGATNPFVDFHESAYFLHCAGHCAFADGRVMVAGGDFTSQGLARKHVGRFDPMASTLGLAALADMHERRWYPTCTTLPNGRIAVFAGWVSTNPVVDADIPEVYDPATDTWEQKTSATRVHGLASSRSSCGTVAVFAGWAGSVVRRSRPRSRVRRCEVPGAAGHSGGNGLRPRRTSFLARGLGSG